ncbi:MAG: carbon starvation induced protein CsiD [Pirellulaceae bacterium]
MNENELARVVAAIGSLFGNPYYHWNRGSAIFQNNLSGRENETLNMRRIDQPDPLHTDTLNPLGDGENYCVFGCVKREFCLGGESELLHIDDWSDLPKFCNSHLATQKLEMKLGDPEFAALHLTRAVFSGADSEQSICWSPRNYVAANDKQQEWLKELTHSLKYQNRTYSSVLHPGQILAFSNKRWLHGRSPIKRDTNAECRLIAVHVS